MQNERKRGSGEREREERLQAREGQKDIRRERGDREREKWRGRPMIGLG